MQTPNNIEQHPLKPFLPEGAKILMLGSFPPGRERWSMEFFYPNRQNDMWRIMGLIFFNNKDYFLNNNSNGFDRERIIEFCSKIGIALYDTAFEVRRLKANASDKFLEIVTPTNIESLIEQLPACQAIVATGQKAIDTIVEHFNCNAPAIGEFTQIEIATRKIDLWRTPSTSRAYPLAIEKKAAIYHKMFTQEGILP